MECILFATNNRHKLEEVSRAVGAGVRVISLEESGVEGCEDIPETADTLRGNALQKAEWVAARLSGRNMAVMADDTGLMVDALQGEPGVRSARYAGPGHDSGANMRLLLEKLQGVGASERTARFVTELVLLEPGSATPLHFTGEVKGRIIEEGRGANGFGYDPIFVADDDPEGRTFAEMSDDEKNGISHRGRAVAKLVEYLTNTNK